MHLSAAGQASSVVSVTLTFLPPLPQMCQVVKGFGFAWGAEGAERSEGSDAEKIFWSVVLLNDDINSSQAGSNRQPMSFFVIRHLKQEALLATDFVFKSNNCFSYTWIV